MRLGRKHYFVAVFLLCLPMSVYAQYGSSLTMQRPAEQAGNVVRDALGRACLDIEAAARAEVINPNVVDHVVSMKNTCARKVKVKVCYYQSDRCKDLEVDGYKRVDTLLGTMSKASSIFRYTVFQR